MSDDPTHLGDVPGGWLAASTALAEATRGLVEAVALTGVPVAELEAARRSVDELAARLGRHRRAHPLRPDRDDLARVLDEPGATLVVRPGNPAAPPLPLELERGADGRTRAAATWTAGPAHEGPPGSLHGGLSAWLLDSVLGSAVQVAGTPAVTGTLTVRYRRRVPLGVPLRITAELGERSGRRLPVTGRIEARGEVCVEAEAVFVTVG